MQNYRKKMIYWRHSPLENGYTWKNPASWEIDFYNLSSVVETKPMPNCFPTATRKAAGVSQSQFF